MALFRKNNKVEDYADYYVYLISIYYKETYYETKYYYVTALNENDALKYLKNYLKNEDYCVREVLIDERIKTNSIDEYHDAVKNIIGKVELSKW